MKWEFLAARKRKGGRPSAYEDGCLPGQRRCKVCNRAQEKVSQFRQRTSGSYETVCKSCMGLHADREARINRPTDSGWWFAEELLAVLYPAGNSAPPEPGKARHIRGVSI